MDLRAAADRQGHRLLGHFLQGMGGPAVRVRLWDGSVLEPAGDAVGTIVLHDPDALWQILLDADLQLGNLWVEKRLSVEGDLVTVLTELFRHREPPSWIWGLVPRRFIERRLRQDRGAATANARHHYDVGNDFYELFLDERMVYTCAYFRTPEATLEEAQVAKLEHVCAKLDLRPGQHVIEAGCGWGALALHMARHHGVTVTAFNVSSEQVTYAREMAEKQGLDDRVTFVEDDYRNIKGACDVFVSVGMLEHVGKEHYVELQDVIDRTLTPHGCGLVHTIGRNREQRLSRWITENVFPNAYPPTLFEMKEVFEPRLAVLDVENLRRHYALTARHWLRRFQAAERSAVELAGERTARVWHFYLAGVVASFEASTLELFQVVFTRVGNERIAWTRDHVYGAENDGSL
jgi:cyclopropane-fatty-acyl-phospholipid synthase